MDLEDMRKELRRHIEMAATPVDYDQLCADGILLRLSKKKFKILDMTRLPEHVGARVGTITWDGIVEFEKTEKLARKLLKKITPK